MVPKIKRSDNPEKITNPGIKKAVRMYDQEGHMRGDVLFLDDEEIPRKRSFRAHHPIFPHVYKTYPKNFDMQDLMVPIFQNGKLVYDCPEVHKIRIQSRQNLEKLDPAFKRFHNPHTYHVSLSPHLFRIKQRLLHDAANAAAPVFIS
jgi:nicotinate phosphoribosyltransferase